MSHIEPKWELSRKYDVKLHKHVVTLTVFTVDSAMWPTEPTAIQPVMTVTKYVPADDYEKFMETINQLNDVKDEKLRQLHILFDEIPS